MTRNHAALLVLPVLALAFWVGDADAERADIPELSVIDTGPDAIIVARDLELGSASVKVRSNRIEVSLIGKPPAMAVNVDDSSLAALGIRVRSTGERRLTITLKGGSATARRLARNARVSQIGDSVQVILGRKPGTEPVAAFVDDYDETPAEAEPEPAKTKATVAAAAPASANGTNKSGEAPAAAGAAEPVPAALGVESSSGGGGGASQLVGLFLVFVAAIACGLGYREWQKRRPKTPLLAGIEVLSVRNVGPKTRLMLVAVGNREMLLTVGPAGSTVLGRWRKNDAGFDDQGDLAEHSDLAEIADLAAPRASQAPPARAVHTSRAPRPAPAAPLDPLTQVSRPLAQSHSPLVQKGNPLAPYSREAAPIAMPPEPARPRELGERPRARTSNPAADALASRANQSASALARRTFPRGSSNPADAVDEWNPRPTSPSIRGILELRDQSLALEDVLGQSDDEVDSEWEQALASGTRAGRLR